MTDAQFQQLLEHIDDSAFRLNPTWQSMAMGGGMMVGVVAIILALAWAEMRYLNK